MDPALLFAISGKAARGKPRELKILIPEAPSAEEPAPSSPATLGPPQPPCPASASHLPSPRNPCLRQTPVSLLRLQQVPSEFGSSEVQVLFSLQDLKQCKEDLGKFSDNPDRYIEAFQNFTQIFELSWRDVMLLLNQTLTDAENQATLQAAERFGDKLCITYSIREVGKHYPAGREAVSMDDPKWDPNDERETWKRRHFQVCIVEGLRRSRTKPLNYTKLSMIDHGFDENTTAFLERLRKVLVKHTALCPDSLNAQIILKDKCVTQGAPDIRRKLQKQVLGPDSALENLLKVATSVFYNRDREAQERERKYRKETEALMVTRQAHKHQNSQGAPSCYRCGKPGYFKKDYPAGMRKPP
uniref:Core shell protein Gag P30 domain-containing protein n=1 Tax=Papio anubis TaxID=9555 RepID=A0A8I5NIW8_PAPAN